MKYTTLTAREDVDAELDGGEVATADLVAQLVETDALAERDLAQAALVARQLVRQTLVPARRVRTYDSQCCCPRVFVCSGSRGASRPLLGGLGLGLAKLSRLHHCSFITPSSNGLRSFTCSVCFTVIPYKCANGCCLFAI